MPKQEWLTLPEAVYEAAGLLTRWQLYTAAMERRIEARRSGRLWELRRSSYRAYVDGIRKARSQ
jgi:hypothetical protein